MAILKLDNLKILYILFIICLTPIKVYSGYLVLGDPWPPWTQGTYGVAKGGIAVEVTKEIFKALDLETEIHLYPWKRAIRMVRYEQADGLLMVQPSNETSDFINYTKPIFISEEIICYNNENNPNFSWQNYKDLTRFKTGINLGYYYGEFSKAVEKHSLKTETARNLDVNLNKLLLGRIDLVICDKAVLIQTIQKNPKYKNIIKIASKPIQVWEYSMGISKSSKLLDELNKINIVIDELKNTGRLSQIIYNTNKQ